MRGFTLIELLVTVAIIGILVSVAVPQYRGYVDSSRLTNAKNNLRAIYLKEQEYFTNNNVYYSPGACGDNAAAINTNLFAGQSIIVDSNFTYCITQTTTTDFTARATKTSTGAIYTLDYNNAANFQQEKSVATKQKKLKILLIEDNGISLNIVSELLADHIVKGAKTAAEGVAEYKEFQPNITFLDISLPDGNGHDLLMQIRKHDKNAYVIMMTASRLKEDILKSMDEGAQGYVVKPFASDMLLQCLKEYYEYQSSIRS